MKQVIRPYQAKDLVNVLSAWENAARLAYPFLPEAFFPAERRAIQDEYLPNAETWVLERDGQVIGFISLLGNEVGGLFVQPAFHGTGAGRQLMDKAKSLHAILELSVFEQNQIGRAFYAKYGFVLVHRKRHEPTGQIELRLRYP